MQSLKWKKWSYYLTLLVIFVGAIPSFFNFPFPDANTTVFHINNAVVTWRGIVNVFVLAIFIAMYVISARNFLVAVDVKHSTLIQKK